MINDYIIGEHVQGTVVNKLTPQGLFWLRMVRRESEGALMVISQSIRCVVQINTIYSVLVTGLSLFHLMHI